MEFHKYKAVAGPDYGKSHGISMRCIFYAHKKSSALKIREILGISMRWIFYAHKKCSALKFHALHFLSTRTSP
jgi:hypothetical protein